MKKLFSNSVVEVNTVSSNHGLLSNTNTTQSPFKVDELSNTKTKTYRNKKKPLTKTSSKSLHSKKTANSKKKKKPAKLENQDKDLV